MRHYTKDHEWIEVAGDVATVGITDHAQEQLGDITYVELPEVGRAVAKGDAFAVVESVKAASDVYAPLAGEVAEINPALDENPHLVNEAAEADGWFVKIKVSGAIDDADLMDASAYKALLATLD
ncbi:MAG: glycine cleavage system protein GcvH [Pseudomonadota bacterium]